MGTLAMLVNFVQAAGVAPATVQVPVTQAPNPLDIIQELLGCRVMSDATAPAGAGVNRTTQIAFEPSAPATAFIVVDQDGKIVATNVTAPGLDYILPPIVRPIQSAPPQGGPNTGVGGLLRSFLNVQQVTVNSGGAAFDPATASIAFVGGLPPADSNRAFRGCVNHLRVVDPGFGYPPGTTIVVMGGGNPLRNARASATFDASGRLRDITLLDMGSRYTAVPTIGFVCPGGVGPVKPAQVGVSMAQGDPATATLTIVAGAITAVNMTSFGNGYVFLPNLVIDPGGPLGSGFIGTVRMGLGRIDIIAHGTGYHDTPVASGAITITPVFQELFPSPNPPVTDANQARPWGRLQSNAIAQQSLSPVAPRAPVIT
jgi:hypothetical protein